MAVYPGAVNLLIPRGTVGGANQQPLIKPTIIILHTNASNTSLAGAASLMLNTTKGQEYHFQQEASGAGRVAGRLGQYVDTTIRADNNFKANSFVRDGVLCGAISVETADHGPPYEKSWTDLEQRRNLEDLVVWLCKTHNIPARRCPDPYSPGIGYHSMWGYNTSSNPNVNPWTNAVGKICPGPGKIREFPDLLMNVARRVAGGTEEDFMTPEDKTWLDAKFAGIDEQVWARDVASLPTATGSGADLQRQAAKADEALAAVVTLNKRLDDLIELVGNLQPGEGGAVALDVTLTGTAKPAI